METYLTDPVLFARLGGLRLRAYQEEVARAIVDSVLNARGRTFAVMFPRQSGKNELQAQIEAYLLFLLYDHDADLVKVSPTWKPQSLNAMRRLERVLERHPCTRGAWQKESGYIYRFHRAHISFFSGAPEANIVGATATHLLEVDEAQDVSIAKFDKDIAPMASSTNATRVFWGTAWTSQTLLARELAASETDAGAASEAVVSEADTGAGAVTAEANPRSFYRQAFRLTASAVAREAPDYGAFVDAQVARLGRSHPMVRTQYFSETIDGQAGMFPPERLERMGLAPEGAPGGVNPCPRDPLPAETYAMLLDVAGEDEAVREGGDAARQTALANPRRDATALTIAAVERAPDATRRDAPIYRAAARYSWVGIHHAGLYEAILALARAWNARALVVDATGVGAGLASFLERALPGKVLPFTFSAASKSRLGWDFLALVDSGRWRERATPQEQEQQRLRETFRQQLAFCQYDIQPGPAKLMRWGVPDGTRDPASGDFVHDDLLVSAALSTLLDAWKWGGESSASPGIVRARDPLQDMRGF